MKKMTLEWVKIWVPFIGAIVAAFFAYQSEQKGEILKARVQKFEESKNLSQMIINGMGFSIGPCSGLQA